MISLAVKIALAADKETPEPDAAQCAAQTALADAVRLAGLPAGFGTIGAT